MIERALIQERGNGRLEPENESVRLELLRRGMPVELFTEKRVHRRQLALDRSTLVVGDIPVVLGALAQLDGARPPPNDYPACLHAFLRRRVWRSTVGALRGLLYDGASRAVFAKPGEKMKRFTGRVFESPSDAAYIAHVGHGTPVLCSDVVEWIAEYRVYVIRAEIVGIKPYSGDAGVMVDEAVVRDAIATLTAAGEAPAGYGIDFGVLRSGETALVELNDGYSLGSYDLDPSLYTDLVIARWEELVGNIVGLAREPSGR